MKNEHEVFWIFADHFLITCEKDGTIPINSRVIAEVVVESISNENKALIAAAPEMAEALAKAANWLKNAPAANPDLLDKIVLVLQKALGE